MARPIPRIRRDVETVAVVLRSTRRGDSKAANGLDTRTRMGLARSGDYHAEIERRRSRDVKRENSQRGAPRPAARSEQRRIHHSPLFWVGVAMFLAAIAIYVWSEDLSRLPWG